MSELQNIYRTVNPMSAKYFRTVWQERTKLSKEQFYKRLKKPETDDILLFCHVCKVDKDLILKPMQDKFKNIPPFGNNLQMTID
ncbi:hypothetical protein [Emticicia sp. W12TSBA100-4]|uniref:hypothetical protein n=1 Tax=Emticicia sp. W12TSBA100-4 TaxID=3160965 RepID=UPI00330652F4